MSISNFVYPVINSKGVFKVSTPFESIVQPNVVFTCVSVSSITTLEERWNVKQSVYLNNHLTEIEYNEALEQDIPIIELRSDTNARVFIPANYVLSYPNADGVIYKTPTLIVSYPHMPQSMRLDSVSDIIVSESNRIYGVSPLVEEKIDPVLRLVSYDEHKQNTIQRKLVMGNTLTDRQQIVRLNSIIDKMTQQITLYQNYIKENITT